VKGGAPWGELRPRTTNLTAMISRRQTFEITSKTRNLSKVNDTNIPQVLGRKMIAVASMQFARYALKRRQRGEGKGKRENNRLSL